jgi:hypothetical protein
MVDDPASRPSVTVFNFTKGNQFFLTNLSLTNLSVYRLLPLHSGKQQKIKCGNVNVYSFLG